MQVAATPEQAQPAVALKDSARVALDALKAARRGEAPKTEAAPAASGAEAAKPVEGAAPAPAAAGTGTTTTEIDVDDKTLQQFVTLSRENRTLKAKATDLEAKAALAAKVEEASKLAKEGKHYDAIRLLGFDFDAAAKEVMGIEQPKVDPEIKALKDEVEALKSGQAQTKEQIDAEAKRVADEQRETGVVKIVAEVTAAADKFPFLSRSPVWVKEALTGADEAYPLLVAKLKRPLTDGEKNNLIKAALEEGEAQHAEEAKLYGAASKTTPATFDSSMRGSLGGAAAAKAKSAATLEELKAARRPKR